MGTKFEEGDDVVVGKYYQKWGNSNSSYVLLKDSHIVYMHAHLVRVVNFLMPPKDHQVQGNDPIYELHSDAAIGIRLELFALKTND